MMRTHILKQAIYFISWIVLYWIAIVFDTKS